MYAYKVEANGPGSEICYRVIGPVKAANDFDFDPAIGSTRGGTAICPCCSTPLSEKHIKAEAMQDRMGDAMIAVVVQGDKSKVYRGVSDADRTTFAIARKRLDDLNRIYNPFSGELTLSVQG